jgi:hypothetical protein
MSDLPTQPETGEDAKTTARIHMALMTDELLGIYLGAAIAQLALRHDKTPTEVVEEMGANGVLPDEEWPESRAVLEKLTRNARITYGAAGVYLAPKRPQG